MNDGIASIILVFFCGAKTDFPEKRAQGHVLKKKRIRSTSLPEGSQICCSWEARAVKRIFLVDEGNLGIHA
jgi:hypothetical protein